MSAADSAVDTGATAPRPRAVVFAVMPSGRGEPGEEEPLNEIKELLSSADMDWVGDVLQRKERPHPHSYLGKGKLVDEFEVTLAKDDKHGRPGDSHLALSPKQPQSSYKSILFIVDPKEYLVRESILVDSQGNTNHFIFDDLEVNGKVSDALFKWTPPAGVRVVDTGQLGK